MSTNQEKSIHSVLAAAEAMKTGKMVIMVDDEDRENEGDLVFAAEFVTAENVNFMAKEARGLICLTLDHKHVDRLRLPLMNGESQACAGDRTTAFTVSIEAKQGVTTGISAQDRATTIRVAIDDDCQPNDITVPGHVFPLRAQPGGVLERAGHTEGSVDLARLAGIKPAAVICEIMRDDGKMARMPDLVEFSEKHSIPIVSIADLITFRLLKDSLVEQIGKKVIATPYGSFDGYLFRSLVDQSTHFALVKGKNFESEVVDVRVHRQRPLEDVFVGEPLIGRERIDYGMKMLSEKKNGVLLYLSSACDFPRDPFLRDFENLRDQTLPMTESHRNAIGGMDQRLYGVGAQVLKKLGVNRMCIHVAVPRPLKALAGFGLEVVDSRVIKPHTER